MNYKAQFYFDQFCFDSGEIGTFEELGFCAEVSSTDFEDNIKVVLVKSFKEVDLTDVGHPFLHTI